jgi:hypothetical protein
MFKHRLVISTVVFFIVSAAWATGVAEPGSLGYSVFTGIPVQERTETLHIQGKEVQVLEIIANLHIMNVPIEPVDFPADFLLVDDPATGHVGFCKSSFEQTYTDFHNGKFPDHGISVLQINLDRTYSSITTDEGAIVYPDRAVQCWEALDAKATPQQ